MGVYRGAVVVFRRRRKGRGVSGQWAVLRVGPPCQNPAYAKVPADAQSDEPQGLGLVLTGTQSALEKQDSQIQPSP